VSEEFMIYKEDTEEDTKKIQIQIQIQYKYKYKYKYRYRYKYKYRYRYKYKYKYKYKYSEDKACYAQADSSSRKGMTYHEDLCNKINKEYRSESTSQRSTMEH